MQIYVFLFVFHYDNQMYFDAYKAGSDNTAHFVLISYCKVNYLISVLNFKSLIPLFIKTRGPWVAHLSKQAKGQTHHLNKPDYWLKVNGWSWPTSQKSLCTHLCNCIY